MRTALVTTTLLAALAVPAIAQPTTAPQPPPQSLAVRLTVQIAGDTRVHELAIFDNGCGHVEDKGAAYEDDIKVCARAAGPGVQIEAFWKTRTNTVEYRTQSATVMARKNSRMEVGRTGGTRFTLQLL
jgi:hypothetical protein